MTAANPSEGAAGRPVYWRRGAPNLFSDMHFNGQFTRTLGYCAFGGAAIGECFAAANEMKDGDFDSWRDNWLAMGNRVKALAEAAEASRHLTTASQRFLRAYNYYRAAEFLISHRSPSKREIYLRARDCFVKSLAYAEDYVGDAVRIPYEETTLPGYFLRPRNGQRRRRTLIINGGGDGSNEECLFLGGRTALQRGYNVLLFEGPGQRGALYEDASNVNRPDYEVVLKAMIDFTIDQPNVDESKIALLGWSLGGHTSARAAAYEHRIRALILSPPITNFYRALAQAYVSAINPKDSGDQLYPPPAELAKIMEAFYEKGTPLIRFAVEQSQWIFGGDTILDFLIRYQNFHLTKSEIKSITCPTLALISTDEGREVEEQADVFKNTMRAPCELAVFGSDMGSELHCALNNQVYAQEIIFDWLETVPDMKEC